MGVKARYLEGQDGHGTIRHDTLALQVQLQITKNVACYKVFICSLEQGVPEGRAADGNVSAPGWLWLPLLQCACVQVYCRH